VRSVRKSLARWRAGRCERRVPTLRWPLLAMRAHWAQTEPRVGLLGGARADERMFEREQHFGDVGRGAVRIAGVRVALEMMMEALR